MLHSILQDLVYSEYEGYWEHLWSFAALGIVDCWLPCDVLLLLLLLLYLRYHTGTSRISNHDNIATRTRWRKNGTTCETDIGGIRFGATGDLKMPRAACDAILCRVDSYCSYSQYSQYSGLQYCSYCRHSQYFGRQYCSYSQYSDVLYSIPQVYSEYEVYWEHLSVELCCFRHSWLLIALRCTAAAVLEISHRYFSNLESQ